LFCWLLLVVGGEIVLEIVLHRLLLTDIVPKLACLVPC
jgi:hypothetical protein